jgi:glyoxylase-like metal-dependent hydrolase (beta-lactamase superfamily II)
MGGQVAPGVLVVETSTVDGKVGVIDGRRAALAVDAGIDRTEGDAVAAAVRSTGHEPEWLVYTHGHIDHVLGGGVFQGTNVLADVAAAGHIRAQIPAWAERGETTPEALEPTLGLPTITFTGDVQLDLGGREVHILATPGHAPGAVSVLLPEAGILFGGDTVVTGIPPSFKDGDSATFERTLRRLALLDISLVVPGHGPIVDGRSAVREAILWGADYLGRCRDHVLSRYGQDDDESIVATAPYERFVGDRFAPDRFRMVWRHEQTIRYILAELARADSGAGA